MSEARYDPVADFYATAFNATTPCSGREDASEAELSALRRQVGAQHRMLSSYLNAFRRHGLWLDELREPVPASQWADSRPGADRVPVYVAGRCLKMRLPADEPVSSPRCAAEAAG